MSTYPPARIPNPAPSRPTTDKFAPRALRWHIITQLVGENDWQRGAEVGTADGRCTTYVLRACVWLNMVTVDPWQPQIGHDGPEDWGNWPHADHEATARARLAPFSDRCRIVKGFSVDVAATVRDGSLDFVFLDGDHSEAGVRADIAAWLPKIRCGGALLGHDAAWPGVRAAIDDLCPGYWIGPNDVWGVSIET
jgi:hypothetical protein